MKQWMIVVVAVALGFAMLTGCKRKACEPELSSEEQLQNEISDVKLKSGHQAAILHIKSLLADAEQVENKASLVAWLFDEYLAEDLIDVVQDAYLSLAADDDEIARLGFSKLMQASMSTNAAVTVAWYEKILAAPVPSKIKAYIWRIRGKTYADAGTIAPVVDRLNEIFELSPELNLSVVTSITQAGLAINDYAGLDALLKALRSRGDARADLTSLLLSVEVDMLLQQKNLKEAASFLIDNAVALGDSALSVRAVKVVVAAVKGDAQDVAVRMVAAAYAGGDERPRTRDRVATRWIRIAEAAGQRDAFLMRVNEALDAGIPASDLHAEFNHGFHMIMMSKDSELQKRCLGVLDRFMAAKDLREGQLGALALLQLDGAFYCKDFKRACEVIEAGVPGYDEKWHEEILDKVKAHLALQEGRKDDAITLFRKHMARVEVWDTSVINPENGAKMTKEAVLGFNEKRIGDIYAGMEGRSKDASAAYARARDWYQTALANLKPDSIEYESAASELAEVPGE